MIVRYLIVAVALVMARAPAHAGEPLCAAKVSFDREFSEDVEGGYFLIGEDPDIAARLRNKSGVSAEFRIIEPYRTKDFGSGVAFLFCDATSNKGVRVTFRDDPSSENLKMIAHPIPNPGTELVELVPPTFLSVSKARTNRVTFRKDAAGRLVIGIGGEVFVVDAGFNIQTLTVQIYCSRSRVRFLDGELTS